MPPEPVTPPRYDELKTTTTTSMADTNSKVENGLQRRSSEDFQLQSTPYPSAHSPSWIPPEPVTPPRNRKAPNKDTTENLEEDNVQKQRGQLDHGKRRREKEFGHETTSHRDSSSLKRDQIVNEDRTQDSWAKRFKLDSSRPVEGRHDNRTMASSDPQDLQRSRGPKERPSGTDRHSKDTLFHQQLKPIKTGESVDADSKSDRYVPSRASNKTRRKNAAQKRKRVIQEMGKDPFDPSDSSGASMNGDWGPDDRRVLKKHNLDLSTFETELEDMQDLVKLDHKDGQRHLARIGQIEADMKNHGSLIYDRDRQERCQSLRTKAQKLAATIRDGMEQEQ